MDLDRIRQAMDLLRDPAANLDDVINDLRGAMTPEEFGVALELVQVHDRVDAARLAVGYVNLAARTEQRGEANAAAHLRQIARELLELASDDEVEYRLLD
jgi:hypothetical protein